MGKFVEILGIFAAIVLPLMNIPLVVRVIKRKSSRDLSLYWAWGVWFCLLAMLPAGLRTDDPVFRIFTIVNLVLFSGVVIVTVIYHNNKPKGE